MCATRTSFDMLRRLWVSAATYMRTGALFTLLLFSLEGSQGLFLVPLDKPGASVGAYMCATRTSFDMLRRLWRRCFDVTLSAPAIAVCPLNQPLEAGVVHGSAATYRRTGCVIYVTFIQPRRLSGFFFCTFGQTGGERGGLYVCHTHIL